MGGEMATINWINSTGGDWFHQANWDLDRNPQAGDDAVVGGSGGYTVSVAPKDEDTDVFIQLNSLTVSDSRASVNFSAPSGDHVQLACTSISNSGSMSFAATSNGISGTFSNKGTLSTGGTTIFANALNNSKGLLIATGVLALDGNAPPGLFTSGTVDLTHIQLEFGQTGSITSFTENLDLTIDFPAQIITDAGSPLSTVASNAGRLELDDGASLGNQAVSFINSGTYVVDNSAISTNKDFDNTGLLELDHFFGTGTGSTFTVAGAFTNSGTLQLGNLAMTSGVTATVGSLVNSGTIALVGASTVKASLVDLTDIAPQTLSGQALVLSGDSLVQFRNGGIASLDAMASISIDGPSAFVADHGHTTKNSALSSLDSNAGLLTLGDGVVLGNAAVAFTNSGTYTAFDHTQVKTSLDFTNSGQLNIDAGAGQAGSSLSVTGTFSNGGTFDFGNVSLSAADLSVVTNLDNTGMIAIAGSSASDIATLKVKGDATNSGTVDIGAFASLTKAHGYTQTAGETDIAGAFNLPDTFIQGGILQGTGKDTGSVVVTGGGIAGGDFETATLGTLSIKGKLVDSAEVDATLVAAGSGAASEIDVTGSKVSLKDGTLHLNITDPANLHAGETFTVLTFTPDILTFGFSHMTDGTHTGDGKSLDLGNGFTLDATYDNAGGDITLTVADTPAHAEAAGAIVHPGFVDWT